MSNSALKTTIFSSLGAGLEYYDFVIYGMMAEYLSTLFFASDEPGIALMKTFSIFAIGYLIRPLGGIVFGMFGDTLGRKKTFLSVMLLMAISTFSIGLLPTYSQIGIAATLLLVFLRVLQGLSFGAELPGAITVVCENSEKERQGTHSSFVISSVSIGSTMASFVLYVLSQSLPKESIYNWAWRIPFLLGGMLAIANYFIRRHLLETPEFTRLQASRPRPSLKSPFLFLIRNFQLQIALGIGMTGFVASLVIFSLYLPTYLTQNFQYAPSTVYLAMTYGMIWSCFSLPFCGWIADRVGKRKILISTCLGFGIVVFPLFSILTIGEAGSLIVFMILYQTFISLVTACYFPLLANIFSTEVRYTGIAACYNITYSVMSFLPIGMTYLIKAAHSPMIAVWFLIFCALISAGSCLLLAKDYKLSLGHIK